MALVQTAAGPVYLPDFLAPPQPPQLDFGSTLGPRGTGSTIDPPPPPPPPPPPLPGELSKHQSIGQTGPAGNETPSLPTTTPSVTGGALPTDMPTATPGGPGADYVAGTAPLMTPKQVDAQNAYNATPEGQIVQAGQEGERALADKSKAIQAEATATAAQGQEDAANAQQAVTDYGDFEKQNAAQLKAKQAIYDQTHAQLDEMINKRAAMKVDDNRLWNDMGTGRKIGLGIAVALTALGDALQHKSGPNAALQIIQGAIAKDVDAQVRERNSLTEDIGLKKDTLGEYAKELGSIEAARTAKMAELTQKAAMMARATAAKYQSPIAKAKGEQLAADLDAQAAQLKVTTATGVSNERYRQAQLQNERANTGISYGHLDLARKQFAEEMAYKYTALLQQGDIAGAKALAAQTKAVAAGGIAHPTTMDANGKVHYEPAVQEDGTPFIVDEKVAPKMKEQYDGYLKYVHALDRLRQIRSESGGHVLDTEQARAAKQALEDALIGGHAALGIEGFRGNIMEVVEKKVTGGADINSVLKDVLPELNNARTQGVRDMNETLHNRYGYTGKDLDIADPLASKAPTTPEQADFQAAMKSGDMSTAEIYGQSLGIDDVSDAMARKQRGQTIPAPVKQTIDGLAATLKSPNATTAAKEQAQSMLQQLSQGAYDESVREYANAVVPGPFTARVKALGGGK